MFDTWICVGCYTKGMFDWKISRGKQEGFCLTPSTNAWSVGSYEEDTSMSKSDECPPKKCKSLFGADKSAPLCPVDQAFVKGSRQNPSTEESN